MGDRDAPISCLFVSDLPTDITEKDLEKLFAGCHGFDSCRLRKDKNEKDVGFVEFRDSESAEIAKDRFKGHILKGHSIAVCYARAGRKRSRQERTEPRDNDGYTGVSSSGHHRTPSGGIQTSLAGGVGAGYLGMGMSGMGGIHAAQAYGMATPRLMQMSAMGLPLRLPGDAHHTLYVEGIPGDATERELAHIFRPFPGYISLRLRAKGGRGNAGNSSSSGDAICFVEFESPYHATIAKMGVVDYRLDKLDRNSLVLRIEYAKAKGGRDRDRGGDRDRY